MEFRKRLQKAAERGARSKDEEAKKQREAALSEEEFRRLHSGYRLPLTEHIEICLQQLAENFPGFRFESVVDEAGWGAAVSRDDLVLAGGRRDNAFSRLLLSIGPFNKYHVIDLKAKGTVRNKECFTRNHFQRLDEVDDDSFRELIELWVLDYAEVYAAAV